jgi:hypothetical protein
MSIFFHMQCMVSKKMTLLVDAVDQLFGLQGIMFL